MIWHVEKWDVLGWTLSSALFKLIKPNQVTTSRARLKQIASLLLDKRLTIITCIEEPETYLYVLCGIQYVTPSFTQTTPEDSKLLAFTIYTRLGKLSTTIDIFPIWTNMEDR